MKRKRIILAGFTALVAAWLNMGTAALVYAAPDPAPATNSSQAAPSNNTGTTPDTQLPGNTSDNSTETIIQPTCSGGGLGWIVCPLINAGVEAIQKVSILVIDMLQIQPLTQNQTLYDAWKSFRNLADIAFILIFMVLIFATTLGINVSAYQLKTLLPKLIAAAILVQISFFITSFAVDIGNVLGAGVGQIFASLGGGQNVGHSVAGVGSVVELSVALITAVIAGFILTWPFVGLMLLALFLSIAGVFITLAARQLIITVLIITSPLALAAWVLPGTNSLFKTWYKNLIRIILLYPLIVIMLSAGGLIARAAQGTDTTHGANTILASLIPIIAFFSIPATFKWAGSILDWAQSNYFMKWSSNASRGVRHSQVAQDIKATRKEKGFERQRDIPNRVPLLGIEGNLGKAVGLSRRYKNRLQAGQIGIGQPSRRRLVSGYDAAIEAQRKDYGSFFDDQQWGNDAVYKLATRNDGESFEYIDPSGRPKKIKNISKAMRIAAVARWTGNGGHLETAKMMEQIFDPDGDNFRGEYREAFNLPKKEVQDIWFRGLGASGKMAETIAAVPPVNPGKANSVWDTMSASQLANIHGSASPFFFKRVLAPVPPSKEEERLGKTVDSLRQDRVERLVESFAQIAKSRELSGRVDQLLMKRFRDAVTPGAEDMDPITKKIYSTYDERFEDLARNTVIEVAKGETMRGDEFLRRYISPLGKIGITDRSAFEEGEDDEE